MRLCVSLFVIPYFLLVASPLAAGHSTDPTRERLETSAHAAALTQGDFAVLSSHAESGDREAQYWLGYIYEEGRIVQKDARQSERWFLKSADQGYVPAERVLGLVYWKDDPVKAALWLQTAAKHGDSEAQFSLGIAYEQGSFGTTNYKEALNWIQKSAKQGHPDAQVSLGQMYEYGEGVKQNYSMAAKWYRKAAEHVPNLGGAGQGRIDLGILYEQGLGVPKDFVQAYMWLSLANGDVCYAKDHMTPPEILDAERMTNKWKSRHPTP
jgi:TPR repeat protein